MARSIRIAILCLILASHPAFAADPPILITGADILDVAASKLIPHRQVLIENGRIAKIADEIRPVPPDTRRIDAAGLTLLPGLTDLHSHLLLHPYNEAPWDQQVLKESSYLRTIRAVVAARTTLEAGFTTLRDLGTEGAEYSDVALRDAIRAGMIPGPNLVVVTRAIVATGCYAPQGYDPRWHLPIGAQVADGVDGCRKAVREQIAGGADWIKVYADYHRAPDAPIVPTFSLEELKAIVDEATSAGLPVAAHATTSEGIRRAVLAGVRTIEHGFSASDEVLRLMKDRGVFLCPTLTAVESYERYAGWKPPAPDPPRLAEAKATFGRAMKIGVTIACGSDVGVFPHGENARELELMVECGMSPADAIKSATLTAAQVLKREGKMGQLSEGAAADVIAVRGDPLRDIHVLRKPTLVIKDGRVIVDRAEKR
jgi:imidazolonepropionase-like amidohydrolase